MTIQGSLESVNLADILQLIGFGQKTGKLNIEAEHLTGEVFFDKGNINYANNSETPFNLEKILLENNLIGKADLKKAKTQAAANKTKIVQEIVGLKLLTSVQLTKIVIDNLSRILYSFFHLKTGTFHFKPDLIHDEFSFLGFKMNINNIIMEGCRRIDEWELIEETIPKSTTVFRFTRDFDKKILNIELHKVEKEIIRLIDGKMDVKSIRKKVELEELSVMKILFSLIQAKIIEVIPEAEVEKISEFYTLGQFYYERENYDEAILELKEVLEHNHLAIYVINLMGIINKINEKIDPDVIKIVNNADFNYLKVGGLSDDGRELIEKIYKLKPIKIKTPVSAAGGKADKKDVIQFQSHYKAAVKLFKEEDFAEALNELNKALEINNKSHNVYLMKGNILFKQKDFKGAVQSWEKSLEINPENEKLKKNLDMIKSKLKI